jgi:RNA polymerase sigma factor (TIGR02999 family)
VERNADSLLPQVYAELRAAAAKLMADERRGHTLQPTALVNEAYAKLAKAGAQFESELHFFNAAAQAMRRILVDHALARGRRKRGGGQAKVELNDLNVPPQFSDNMDWLALDEALTKLAEVSPRQAQVVMLRFFAGLGDAQIAQLLQISEPTVRRDWATARPWLFRQMNA